MAKAKIKETIGVGRRKRAVASVRLRKGTGKFRVNGKALEEYFPSTLQRKIIHSPLDKTESFDKYDFIMTIKGGGIEAQAVAARLGISRALVQENEQHHSILKDLGYLTRDPRKKERKKYGLAGARKRFQFSKR